LWFVARLKTTIGKLFVKTDGFGSMPDIQFQRAIIRTSSQRFIDRRDDVAGFS